MKSMRELMMEQVEGECEQIQKAGKRLGEFLDVTGLYDPPFVYFAYCAEDAGFSVTTSPEVFVYEDDGVVLMSMSFAVACREFAEDGNHNIVDDIRIAEKTNPRAVYILSATSQAGRYLIGTLTDKEWAQA